MQLVASLHCKFRASSSVETAAAARDRATLLEGSCRHVYMPRRSIVVQRYRYRWIDAQRWRTDCTTVAANEHGDRTGCYCLSSEADPPNFEIVICVYNWDVSCDDSVYPCQLYRPFIRIVCATSIGNQPLFFSISASIRVFNLELLYWSSTCLILRIWSYSSASSGSLEINGNIISVSYIRHSIPKTKID